MMSFTVGLGGVQRHGCVALSDGRRLLGICEQERVTRVRGAGFNHGGLPDQALELLLARAGASRADVARYVTAEDGVANTSGDVVRIDHHYAHACAAYLTSPHQAATIVVCDGEQPKVTVWKGRGAEVAPVAWTWSGIGFADLYSACAAVVGFKSNAGDQRFEALARLAPRQQNDRIAALFNTDGHRLIAEDGWQQTVAGMLATPRSREDVSCASAVAAALQARIAELFIELLAAVRSEVGSDGDALCLGGSFFYHSSMNTIARTSGLFPRVFVPVDPGNAGLAAGTALQAIGAAPQNTSPFLGPKYEPDEIKADLDNCKLPYNWADESEAIAIAVDALQHGRLVGWYEGSMEWGPRALGSRSILANPFAPFVLENLNQFLKRRERWRGYALSTTDDAVSAHFSGPDRAPFMECDYRPLDAARFKHVLPSPEASIRVHTAGPETPRRFRELLQAFGKAAGVPCLVNTSFNGFHEPIVCTPRDAVRVFFGSGVDVLLLDRFVLTK
jgi:carbamoyltransferase